MVIILIKLANNLWVIENGSINVCTEFELGYVERLSKQLIWSSSFVSFWATSPKTWHGFFTFCNVAGGIIAATSFLMHCLGQLNFTFQKASYPKVTWRKVCGSLNITKIVEQVTFNIIVMESHVWQVAPSFWNEISWVSIYF